ncbi:hypothetical protein ES702_04515 [subsurface metagenome]
MIELFLLLAIGILEGITIIGILFLGLKIEKKLDEVSKKVEAIEP